MFSPADRFNEEHGNVKEMIKKAESRKGASLLSSKGTKEIIESKEALSNDSIVKASNNKKYKKKDLIIMIEEHFKSMISI